MKQLIILLTGLLIINYLYEIYYQLFCYATTNIYYLMVPYKKYKDMKKIFIDDAISK